MSEVQSTAAVAAKAAKAKAHGAVGRAHNRPAEAEGPAGAGFATFVDALAAQQPELKRGAGESKADLDTKTESEPADAEDVAREPDASDALTALFAGIAAGREQRDALARSEATASPEESVHRGRAKGRVADGMESVRANAPSVRTGGADRAGDEAAGKSAVASKDAARAEEASGGERGTASEETRPNPPGALAARGGPGTAIGATDASSPRDTSPRPSTEGPAPTSSSGIGEAVRATAREATVPRRAGQDATASSPNRDAPNGVESSNASPVARAVHAVHASQAGRGAGDEHARGDGEKRFTRTLESASEDSRPSASAPDRTPQILNATPAAAAAATPPAGTPVTRFDAEVPVGHPEWTHRIAHIASVALRNGLQEAEIRVRPDDMGPITMKVSLDGDTASVAFTAANADTVAALQDGLPQLRETLAASGLQLGQASVSSDASGGSAGTGGNFDSAARPGERQNTSSGERGEPRRSERDPAAAAPEPPRPRASQRIVDTFA